MSLSSYLWPFLSIPVRFLGGLGLYLFLSSCTATFPVNDSVSYFLAGDLAYRSGDSRTSYGYMQKALFEDPENPALLKETFDLALRIGDFDAARAYAEKLSRMGHMSGPESMFLAILAFKEARYESMETYLENVRGLGLDTLVVPLVRAWAAAKQGEAETAMAAISPLEAYTSFRTFRQTQAAYIMDYMGANVEAESAYKIILAERNFRTVHPILSYGRFLERQNRRAEALNLYSEYLELLSGNDLLEAELQKLQTGVASGLSEIRPETALAQLLTGIAIDLVQDNALAPSIMYAQLGVYTDQENAETILLAGNILMTDEDPAAAIHVYNKIDKEMPEYEDALVRKALALDDLDRRSEAIRLLERHLDDVGESALVYTTLGDLYRFAEEWRASLDHYDHAVSVQEAKGDTDWFLYFTRGIVYDQLDNWLEAEADFRKSLAIEPDQPDVLNYLGYTLIDRGLAYEEARIMVAKALAARPNDGNIVDSQGWVQFRFGEYENAVETLERAVELEPGDPLINDHLGDAYWMIGKKRQARFQWQRSLSLNPEPEDRAKTQDKLENGLTDVEGIPNTLSLKEDRSE